MFRSKKNREECAECGGQYTNHTLTKINATMEAALNKAEAFRWVASFSSITTTIVSKIVRLAWPVLSKVALVLRIVSYNTDSKKALDARLSMIWNEAGRRNIPMRQLLVFGTPTEFFEVYIQNAWQLFYMFPIPANYATEVSWPDDKYLLKQRLLTESIATPLSISVSTFSEAHKVMERLGTVCVKPRSGSNGRHTFPYVQTKEQLRDAFYSAKKLCHWVVVEQHLEGNLVRATCVGGVLVGFLECQSPIVVGDGHTSIRALIQKQNESKSLHIGDIEITSVHEKYIMRRGYTLDSVLEAGKKLPLIYWAGFGSGGRNWERGTDIHPELRQELERAARLTELPVVGFDVIIEDAFRAPSKQTWGIIEANSVPWINLHNSTKYEKSINVGAAIWDLWGKSIPQKVLAEAKTF